MSALNPIGVSVTWGAGGTTHDKSLDLAEIIQNEYSIDTLLHLTCTNMVEGTIDMALRVSHAAAEVCLILISYIIASKGSRN